MTPVRTPRFWGVTVGALLVVGLTASLGLWQLDRAAQKRALASGMATQAALTPWTNRELLDSSRPADGVHRSVQLSGRWVPGATVFLDNRPMGGRAGFIVLAALRLEGGEHAVLVQRGWVPRDFQDRSRVPDLPLPESDVRITGRLAPPPSQLFEPGTGAPGPIRQNIELSALASEWGVTLLPGVSVLQVGANDDGLLRDWPRFAGEEHKHLAYAAQWFAMSAIAAGLYLWFQIFQPRFRRTTHGQDAR